MHLRRRMLIGPGSNALPPLSSESDAEPTCQFFQNVPKQVLSELIDMGCPDGFVDVEDAMCADDDDVNGLNSIPDGICVTRRYVWFVLESD